MFGEIGEIAAGLMEKNGKSEIFPIMVVMPTKYHFVDGFDSKRTSPKKKVWGHIYWTAPDINISQIKWMISDLLFQDLFNSILSAFKLIKFFKRIIYCGDEP